MAKDGLYNLCWPQQVSKHQPQHHDEQRNRFSTSEVLNIIELDEPVGADSDDSLELDLESL